MSAWASLSEPVNRLARIARIRMAAGRPSWHKPVYRMLTGGGADAMIPRPGALTLPRGEPADDRAPSGRGTRADMVVVARPPLAKRGAAVVPGLALSPAMRQAELLLAGQNRQVGSRPVRVPGDAFVPIGTRLLPSPSASRLMLAAPGANDNAVPARPGSARPLLREALFLLILAATLAGTYWIGRLNAAQNVIVVPGPSSSRSVVT